MPVQKKEKRGRRVREEKPLVKPLDYLHAFRFLADRGGEEEVAREIRSRLERSREDD